MQFSSPLICVILPPPCPQVAVWGSVTLCYLAALDEVSAVHHQGALEGEQVKGAIKLALEAALMVKEAARQCLQATLSQCKEV